MLDSQWAKSHKFQVGSVLKITTPLGKVVPYTVSGLFKNKAGLTANVIVNQQTMPSRGT